MYSVVDKVGRRGVFSNCWSIISSFRARCDGVLWWQAIFGWRVFVGRTFGGFFAGRRVRLTSRVGGMTVHHDWVKMKSEPGM